jgi:hypothetical protein
MSKIDMGKIDGSIGSERPFGPNPAIPLQSEPVNQVPPPSATTGAAPRAGGTNRAGPSLLSQFHSPEPHYRRSLFRR